MGGVVTLLEQKIEYLLELSQQKINKSSEVTDEEIILSLKDSIGLTEDEIIQHLQNFKPKQEMEKETLPRFSLSHFLFQLLRAWLTIEGTNYRPLLRKMAFLLTMSTWLLSKYYGNVTAYHVPMTIILLGYLSLNLWIFGFWPK